MSQIPVHSVAPVKGAIRNSANANRFMVVQPVEKAITINVGDDLVVQTNHALRVIDIGTQAYQPRVYVSERDIKVTLSKCSKTTHCPLKGNAIYYAFREAEVGWRYDRFDFADILSGHICLSAPNMRITEGV
ncbi:MAG: DUF427 domain-containing protein [Rhodobacteraceae bacterium]|nr:DUF427 domain-containing protein [Paracoccaceae bacterium]